MKISIINIFYTICILLSVGCFAHEKKPLTNEQIKLPKLIVLSEVYPPYQVVSKEGELYGWSTDKVKALMKQARIDHKIDILPWARAYQLALINKNTLIYSLLRTDSREDLFHWIAPLCTVDFSLYRLKSNTYIEVHSMRDAKKYLIAAQKGQASTEYLLSMGFEDEKNLSVSYHNDNFIQMLVHGRVELIVLSTSYVQSLKSKNVPNINEIEAIYAIEYLRKSLYLAASLNTSPIMLKKLQKAYDDLLPQFNSACLD